MAKELTLQITVGHQQLQSVSEFCSVKTIGKSLKWPTTLSKIKLENCKSEKFEGFSLYIRYFVFFFFCEGT